MIVKALGLCLVIIALFWAFVLLRARQQEEQAVSRFPPSGQILNIDGVQVHAEIMGSGPDLVLIHGASGNTRDMTFALAPRLAETYRVLVFDRPGLGYTDRINSSGATIRQQAELLMRAAQQLDAPQPIVVGHSYGGAVALAWASYYPETLSALVTVSAPSNPWTTPLDPLYRVTSSWWGSFFVVPVITAFVGEARVKDAIASIFAPQSPPDGYAEHIGAPLTLRRISMRANADQRANLLKEIQAMLPLYDQISVPTEIVHGTADDTVGLSIHSEKLVNQIADAALTRLPNIGHMPHHVDTDAVVAAIDRAAHRAGLR